MIRLMYLGEVVEKAPAEELVANPIHPYTKALLFGIPIPKRKITSPIEIQNGCRFAERCMDASDKCYASCPGLKEVTPNHFVACHLTEE